MKTVEDGTAPGYQSVISYLHYQQIPGSFTGNIYYFTLNRDFLNGWGWQNGSLSTTVALGNIVTQTNNSIHHLEPAEDEPCIETTYTLYTTTTTSAGVVEDDDLFSISEISCPEEVSGTVGITPGGANGSPSIPVQNPCNAASNAVAVQCIKGRVVDVASGGTGTGSSGGSSNPCITVKTVSPVDPCKQSAQLSAAAANAFIAAQNNKIEKQSASGEIEYGANQNLTSVPGSTYINNPNNANTQITPGTIAGWTPTFTWDSTNGYTIGYSHGHPNDTGPSPYDVASIVYPIGQIPALRQSGPNQQFYEANAYVNTETSTGSYIVTVSNWPAISITLQNSFGTNSEENSFNAAYAQQISNYLTDNTNATQGDAGAYALLQMFPGEINVYYASPGSTTYAPLVAGNNNLTAQPCPTN